MTLITYTQHNSCSLVPRGYVSWFTKPIKHEYIYHKPQFYRLWTYFAIIDQRDQPSAPICSDLKSPVFLF